MKTTTRLLLLLCAISAAALRWGGSQSFGNQAAAGIAFLLPQPQVDFSDLEVRDNQNRIVLSPSASQKLEALFRENLVNLLVIAAPHSIAKDIAWINSISYLFNNLILSRLYIFAHAVQDAILPSIRRFVHNVNNLCISFFVGVFAACLLLSSFSLLRTPRNVYLRC